MKKDDYSMRYFVANFICFIVVYILRIIIFFKIIEMCILRIIFCILDLYLCSQLETRYFVFYVNYMAALFLPQNAREKELELLKKSKKNDKDRFILF